MHCKTKTEKKEGKKKKKNLDDEKRSLDLVGVGEGRYAEEPLAHRRVALVSCSAKAALSTADTSFAAHTSWQLTHHGS
eukprot:3826326-Rhodomonas_salina.1